MHMLNIIVYGKVYANDDVKVSSFKVYFSKKATGPLQKHFQEQIYSLRLIDVQQRPACNLANKSNNIKQMDKSAQNEQGLIVLDNFLTNTLFYFVIAL